VSRVAYGVCVGSWDKFTRNVVPRVGDRPVYALAGHTSIAVAYNQILRTVCDRHALPPDVLVLQHDDLEITDPDGEAKLLTAVSQPGVALAGVAGAATCPTLAWWNTDPVGHQVTDVMNIDFGQRTGDVILLEGSVLAFSPWAIATLRFDVRFPGFHGYDEIGMQAHHHGKRNVVVDVDTHHHTAMGFKTTASHEQWLHADRLFREKWKL
jgi:hypothetical protein